MEIDEKILITFQKIGQAYLRQAIMRVSAGQMFQLEIDKPMLKKIIAEVSGINRGELAVSEKEIRDALIAMIMPGPKAFLEE